MKATKSFAIVSRNFLFAAFALASMTVVGCGDDPVNPGDNTTSVVPKSGSIYNYTSYKTVNGARVNGSDSTYRSSVVANARTFEGKSNVVTFFDGSDSTYLAYESNGDVSLYATNDEGEGMWMKYPFASKTTFSLPEEVSYIEIGGGIDTVTTKITAKHVGTQEVTVGSEKLATQKVEFELNIAHNWEGESGGSSFKTTFYYAPKIGMFARADEEATITQLDGTVSRTGEIRNLSTYTLIK